MNSKKKIVAAGLGAVMILAAVAVVYAVHDKAFELDGNILGGNPPNPPTVDWADLFNVPANNGTPTTKASLPADFSTAVFVRDFAPGATDDSSTFATGSKDTLNIGGGGWQCKPSNNVTDKGDILNTYATAYVDPVTKHVILYFALEISSNEGTKDVGFWFVKDPNVGCVAGKNATDFTGSHTDGDVLVVSEYTQGGGVSTIKAFAWSGGANGSLNPTPILTGADCQNIGGGDNICATVNKVGSPGPLLASSGQVPWLTQTKTSKPSQPGLTSADLDVGEFFEGAIDLNAAGLSGCFTGFLADTRSSAEIGATLYDFAFGSFNLCNLSVGKACATGVANNPQLLQDGVTLRTTFNVPISSTGAATVSNIFLAETPQPALISGEVCRITAIETKTGAVPNPALTLPFTFSGTTAVKVYNSLGGNTTGNVTVQCDTVGRNPFQDTVTVTSADISGTRTHTTGGAEMCAFVGNPTATPAKCCQSVTIDPDTLQAKVCVDITVTNNSNPAEPLVQVSVVDNKIGAVPGLTNISLAASGAGASKKVTECYTTNQADQTGDPRSTSTVTFSDKLTSLTGKGAVSNTTFSVDPAVLPSATCPLCGPGTCPVP